MNTETADPNKLAWVRIILNAITIPIILTGFFYTSIQFRKASAKPKIELLIGQDNNEFSNYKTSKEVIVNNKTYSENQLYLWINNTGDSVAKTFQIDIEVPSIFDPINYNTKKGRLDSKIVNNGNIRVYTFYNTKIPYFINKPEYINDTIILGLHNERYNEYENEYSIKYKIFGDWGETQEGKLKVIIKKQEAPHA